MNESQEDRIVSEFLRSIGPWREFVVIGGGFALFVYKLYLADPKLKNIPVGTRDIDSLIPRRIPEVSKKSLSNYLEEAGFIHVFRDVNIPATESYIKEIDGVEVEIEFLTDALARKNKHKNVVISGIVAQPLNYLNVSLQHSVEFQTTAYETGRVVSPEAWIFHKGLTFTKRKSHLKILKDLYGIWYVTTQLGDFSDRTLVKFNKLTWNKLEAQDPSGRLRKLNFERIISKLVAPDYLTLHV